MKPARLTTFLLLIFILFLAWEACCQEVIEVKVTGFRKTYPGWSYFPNGYNPVGWTVGLRPESCGLWLDENCDLWFGFYPVNLDASYIFSAAFEWVSIREEVEVYARLDPEGRLYDLWKGSEWVRQVPAVCSFIYCW